MKSVPEAIKRISSFLSEKGISKDNVLVIDKPICIRQDIDEPGMLATVDVKIKALYPENGTVIVVDSDDNSHCPIINIDEGNIWTRWQTSSLEAFFEDLIKTKPRIETIDGVQYLIVHDIQDYKLTNRYREMGTPSYDIDKFEIKFTIDEVRVARFSINQGTAGKYLRIALDETNGTTEYHYLAEDFKDIKKLFDFELRFREKWPLD